MFRCCFFTVWLFRSTLAHFISDSVLLRDPEPWNSGLQPASTCMATANGLQGQIGQKAFWLRVCWWKAVVIWEEPELKEENMKQRFSRDIKANVFLFYVSRELRMFAQSIPRIWLFDNLLRNSKWITCLQFWLGLIRFLISISAVDLANHFLRLFQSSWHGSNRKLSFMPRFICFLTVFHPSSFAKMILIMPRRLPFYLISARLCLAAKSPWGNIFGGNLCSWILLLAEHLVWLTAL